MYASPQIEVEIVSHKPNFLKRAFSKMGKFITDVVLEMKSKIIEFVKGVYHHAESITMLTLSAIGLNSLMGEIPFMYALPMWIESALVIPVLSVLIIILLCKSAEVRSDRRAKHNLAHVYA